MERIFSINQVISVESFSVTVNRPYVRMFHFLGSKSRLVEMFDYRVCITGSVPVIGEVIRIEFNDYNVSSVAHNIIEFVGASKLNSFKFPVMGEILN